MIWTPERRHRPTRPTSNSQSGAAAERLELLKIRDSTDPTARAVALGFSLILRRLDDIAQGLEVES